MSTATATAPETPEPDFWHAFSPGQQIVGQDRYN